MAFSDNYFAMIVALNRSGSPKSGGLKPNCRSGSRVLGRELEASPIVSGCTFPLDLFFFLFFFLAPSLPRLRLSAVLCSWELASRPAVLIERGPNSEADRRISD